MPILTAETLNVASRADVVLVARRTREKYGRFKVHTTMPKSRNLGMHKQDWTGRGFSKEYHRNHIYFKSLSTITPQAHQI